MPESGEAAEEERLLCVRASGGNFGQCFQFLDGQILPAARASLLELLPGVQFIEGVLFQNSLLYGMVQDGNEGWVQEHKIPWESQAAFR